MPSRSERGTTRSTRPRATGQLLANDTAEPDARRITSAGVDFGRAREVNASGGIGRLRDVRLALSRTIETERRRAVAATICAAARRPARRRAPADKTRTELGGDGAEGREQRGASRCEGLLERDAPDVCQRRCHWKISVVQSPPWSRTSCARAGWKSTKKLGSTSIPPAGSQFTRSSHERSRG
jgi:hypothetical protein